MPSRSRKQKKMPVTENGVTLNENKGGNAPVKTARTRRRKKIPGTEEAVEVKEEPGSAQVVVSDNEVSEGANEADAVLLVQSSVRVFSSPKKAKTNKTDVPAVSSSSVQQGSGPLRSLFDGADGDDVWFYCIGHATANKPNLKGSYISKRLGFLKNTRNKDTIPGGFGKYVVVVLKGWGNMKHYASCAQQVNSMVPGMLYRLKETKKGSFGQIKFQYAPTYSPNDMEVMLGDGTLAIPCSTPISKDDMCLKDRTKIAAIESKEHGFNTWFVARLGDKDILQDGGQSNACGRLVYDESGMSVQLIIWDEDCPLAMADSGSVAIFWAYVNQRDQYPKKLSLISGGILEDTAFEGEAAFMPIPQPPFVAENKFLPCITAFDMKAFFACRPMTGVRILHNIPFVLECLEDEEDYVDFLCPTCSKKLTSDDGPDAVVYSCVSHGNTEIDNIELVCHPMCRLSVRLGNDDSSDNIFVTSAKLAKNQEEVVFGHSCNDICRGATLIPHDGEKFTGTFFISASGISVDNISRVNSL